MEVQGSEKITKIDITKSILKLETLYLVIGMKVVLDNPQPEDLAPRGCATQSVLPLRYTSEQTLT